MQGVPQSARRRHLGGDGEGRRGPRVPEHRRQPGSCHDRTCALGERRRLRLVWHVAGHGVERRDDASVGRDRSGALLSTLHGHTASVTAVVVVPGRPHIVSAAADGTLRWPTWRLPMRAASRGATPTATSTASMSRLTGPVATAAWGGKLTMWEAATGRVVWQAAVHERSANAVAFSPDGQRLISGGNDGRLQLVDAATGAVIATWEHVTDGRAAGIAWSPDGRFVSSRPPRCERQGVGRRHRPRALDHLGDPRARSTTPRSRPTAGTWRSGGRTATSG